MAKDKEPKQDAKPKGGEKGGDKGAPQQKPAQQAKPQGKKEAPKPAPVAKEQGPRIPAPPARLAIYYREKVVPELMQKFGYKTVMQVPRIKKITLNMGVGETTTDKKVLDNAVVDMTRIAGQKPVVTKSRKSIANFKVRANFPVGCMVTLRRARMYEFLDRLTSVAIPRIRDFRGLSTRSFDGRGNYSLGVREQIIFPEVDYDSIDQVRGLDVTITTSARTDEEAFALLSEFGMPFQRDGRPGEDGAAGDEEEERRKEEARLRAEAEQAALEQLKEENPEAYEKHERAEEDTETEEGEEHRPPPGTIEES